jgi:hypothetical protein
MYIIAMKPSNQLIQRIKNELKIHVLSDVKVHRMFTGRHQKTAGAWTGWFGSESDPIFEIGYYIPISELVYCPKLIIGDNYGMYVDCGCIGMCKGTGRHTIHSK